MAESAAPAANRSSAPHEGKHRERQERSWFWEGNIQSALVSRLVQNGYVIHSVAHTTARTAGKDIIATTPEGKEIWISVKGYPESSQHVQARHWFAAAIFDMVLYRGESKDVLLAMALPEGFATYAALARRTAWFKASLPLVIYWVAEGGAVRVEAEPVSAAL